MKKILKTLLTSIFMACLCITNAWGEDVYLLTAQNANNATGNYVNPPEAHKFSETSTDVYTLEITTSTMSYSSDKFHFRVSVSGWNGQICPSENNHQLVVGGNPYGYAYSNEGGKGDFTFTLLKSDVEKYSTITIKVNIGSNNDNRKIEVTGVLQKIQLKSTIDSWHGTNYDSYENGVYTWTWNKTQLSGISAGSHIDFQLYDPDTGYWYGMSSRTSLDNNTWSTSTANGTSNTQNWYTTHQKGYTYTIEAKKSGSQWQIRYIRNEEDHDYYWVSPEITNNQKWEYFKMVPSRNRQYDGSTQVGDGKISDKYFSFTIKDDDLKKWDGTPWPEGTNKIRWYVVRDDDAKWFRPTADVDKGTSYDGIYKGPNNNNEDFWYNNFEDIGTTTNRETYISFSKGARKSYTFILNAKPSSGTGNLYVDSPIDNVGNTGIDYYLIGNFSSASGNVPITIDKTRKMDQLWYKDGTEFNTDNVTDAIKASPDSVVYQYYVKKPNEGWGDLYLLINPGDNANNDWQWVYRPLISLYNCLDGRALVGGLTKSGYGRDTSNNLGDQSLNPEPSNFYSGYTLRFNATTMTYHLEFHTSLYLVGDAVTADGKGGSWNIRDDASLIPLKATQDSRHFRNTVTFVNGAVSGTNKYKGFRFLLTEDASGSRTYARNWGENSNAPRWLSLDESQDHFDGPDTQYKNYLQYNENNSSTEYNDVSQNGFKADNTPDIIFDLADGEYVINFYNYASPYYTIERKGELRDYNEVIYKGNTRYILGRGETGTGDHTQRDFTNAYKHFCVWSDYIAWNKPDDVDVYALTAFTPSDTHTATVTLTKQDISYIPAKKAVILAMKTDKNSLNGGMVYDAVKPADLLNNTGFNRVIMDMTPYATPDATLGEGVGVSNFKPQYKSIVLPYSEGNMYNYLFGFFHANHVVSGNLYDNQDFLLGFWKNTGSGYTYPNSGYLQLSKTDAETLGVGAYGITATEGGSDAPAFLLLFEDEDSSVVTGIRDQDAEVPGVKDSADDNWYTLSGVRIAQPTAKGIYIHGGKKVIVR